MRKLQIAIATILILANLASSLHFQRVSQRHFTTDPELQALRSQQAEFEKQINGLISNISDIQQKVNSSSDTSDKVIILQNAITSQRQKIYDIQNLIIPPFNLSKNACEQLTNQQKISLLNQVSQAKKQIAALKNLSASLPPCEQITLINSDIQKQTVLIDSIQKIIYSKCQSSIILSPTIFQSNIYASNWILGNQTIDDLIEEYYQRSMQYPNVTNCPSSFPFFDGKSCINCTGSNPVFNMYSKKCDSCPFDTTINTDLRTCQQIPHYTDFSLVQNYMLDNKTALPTPDPSLTPCNPKKPYFNGSCVSCKLPYYWSVNDNICKSCPAGNVFDINKKTCTAPSGESLSILQCNPEQIYNSTTLQCQARQILYISTNFNNLLTSNSTKISDYKAQLLKKVRNNGDQLVKKCPDPAQYSNFTNCFTCKPGESFDIQSTKCETCNGTIDSNTRICIPKTTLLTNLNSVSNLLLAPNKTINDYTKIQNSISTPVQNCPDSNPYSVFGRKCIACTAPNLLFDLQTQTCTSCPSLSIYNNKTKICVQLQNVTNTAALKNYIQIDNYTLANIKIQNDLLNQTKPTILCSADLPIFDGTKCTSCPKGSYINLKTLQCVGAQLVTNVNQLKINGNYFQNGNYTLQNIAISIQNLDPTPTVACDALTPVFNGSSCYSCPGDKFYNLKTNLCVSALLVTNVATLRNLTNLKQSGNSTLNNIQSNINASTLPTQVCDASQPLFDGKKCIFCDNYSIYDIQNLVCIPPQLYTNVTAVQATNYFQTDNYTLTKINASNAQIPRPNKPCPSDQPLFNGVSCISCPNGTYYNLKSSNCFTPILVSNTAGLSNSKSYVQVGNSTLANLTSTIKNITFPTTICNTTTPLFNGIQCISCPQSLYNLQTLSCFNCTVDQYYNSTLFKCLSKPHFYPNLTNFNWTINDFNGIDRVINFTQTRAKLDSAVPCPAGSEFFNNITLNCQSCSAGTYFNYDQWTCISCPAGQQLDVNTHKCNTKTVGISQTNLNSANLLYGGLPINQYNDYYKSNVTTYPKINDCPTDKPYFDGFQCIQCRPQAPFFNLAYKVCESCQSPSVYDPVTKNCRANGQVQTSPPNPAKMFSSIF